jgi:hypothetical protein
MRGASNHSGDHEEYLMVFFFYLPVPKSITTSIARKTSAERITAQAEIPMRWDQQPFR